MATPKLNKNDISKVIEDIKKLNPVFNDVDENLVTKALLVRHSFKKIDINNVDGILCLKNEFLFSEDDNERVDIIHKLIKYYQKTSADNEPEEYLNNILIEVYRSSILLDYKKGKMLVIKQLLKKF